MDDIQKSIYKDQKAHKAEQNKKKKLKKKQKKKQIQMQQEANRMHSGLVVVEEIKGESNSRSNGSASKQASSDQP